LPGSRARGCADACRPCGEGGAPGQSGTRQRQGDRQPSRRQRDCAATQRASAQFAGSAESVLPPQRTRRRNPFRAATGSFAGPQASFYHGGPEGPRRATELRVAPRPVRTARLRGAPWPSDSSVIKALAPPSPAIGLGVSAQHPSAGRVPRISSRPARIPTIISTD